MLEPKIINLVIFGIGNVGGTLIDQINKAKEEILQKQQLELRIIAVANSTSILFDEFGVSENWHTEFTIYAKDYNLKNVFTYIKKHEFKNLIAIDATVSTGIVANYLTLIKNDFNLVSANKIANTLDYEFYQKLRLELKKYRKEFLYETNVGAGLPIVETVKNLHQSGEKVLKVRGVFSGSLSYIFNTYSSKKVLFSDVLKKASELGLTEPDAREDLSGNDVARKLLILARELEVKKELEEVSIQSLVPNEFSKDLSVDQFNHRKVELDSTFETLKTNLPKDKVLRYVAELNPEKGQLEVKLVSEDKKSALGQLKGSDSAFEIYSESYGNNPLVIQGAGAGKEVTARGIITDLIKISNSLN